MDLLNLVRDAEKEYEETEEVLKSFKNTINRIENISKGPEFRQLVPFGKLAYFPGKIVNTNEVFCSIGSNYIVKKTAAGACETLQKSVGTIESQMDLLQERLDACRTELDKIAPKKGSNGNGTVRKDQSGHMVIEEEEEDSDFDYDDLGAAKNAKAAAAPLITESVLRQNKTDSQKEYSALRNDLLAKLEEMEEEAGEDEAKQAAMLEEYRALKAQLAALHPPSASTLTEADKHNLKHLPAAAAHIPEDLGKPVQMIDIEKDLIAVPPGTDPEALIEQVVKSRTAAAAANKENNNAEVGEGLKKGGGLKSGFFNKQKKTQPAQKSPCCNHDSAPCGSAAASNHHQQSHEVRRGMNLDEVANLREDQIDFKAPPTEADTPVGAVSDLAKEMAAKMFGVKQAAPAATPAYPKSTANVRTIKRDDDSDDDDAFGAFKPMTAAPMDSSKAPSKQVANFTPEGNLRPPAPVEKAVQPQEEEAQPKMSLFKQRMLAKKGF